MKQDHHLDKLCKSSIINLLNKKKLEHILCAKPNHSGGMDSSLDMTADLLNNVETSS